MKVRIRGRCLRIIYAIISLHMAICLELRCRYDTAIYDAKHNTCLIKPGKKCIEGFGCVNNAHCLPLIQNSVSVCACSDTFHQSPDGRCVHGFNGTCMSSGDCDEGLECKENVGRCACPFADEFYVSLRHKCVAAYGNQCSDECLNNFICQNSKCVCPEGFQLAKKGLECFKGFGTKCEGNEECDDSRSLLCLQGQCECQHPFQEYSKMGCVGLEGAHCNLSSAYQENPFCVEGTSCQPIIGSEEVGMCKREDVIIPNLIVSLAVFAMGGLAVVLLRTVWKYRRSFIAPEMNAYDEVETATTTTFASCKNVSSVPDLGKENKENVNLELI